METNLRACKICKQLKQRIEDGKFNNKDRRWKDESGKLWNGSCCPTCNLERTKEKMRNARSKTNVKSS
jgi:hypothetical protein